MKQVRIELRPLRSTKWTSRVVGSSECLSVFGHRRLRFPGVGGVGWGWWVASWLLWHFSVLRLRVCPGHGQKTHLFEICYRCCWVAGKLLHVLRLFQLNASRCLFVGEREREFVCVIPVAPSAYPSKPKLFLVANPSSLPPSPLPTSRFHTHTHPTPIEAFILLHNRI